ncbi:hypothetical protein C2845_PM09G21210 [Panicum miliaceum]|uniref:Transcription elongation factor 1 homolog n=1 Tax=Panicum miliaceum TaxID=4540 RepID=A0A3L6S315_PANMI|nr:hypothetical protein C2845_PM09G21210 [Panicum miliaceum]
MAELAGNLGSDSAGVSGGEPGDAEEGADEEYGQARRQERGVSDRPQRKVAKASCWACGASYSGAADALTEPIDVYCGWIDEHHRASTRRDHDGDIMMADARGAARRARPTWDRCHFGPWGSISLVRNGAEEVHEELFHGSASNVEREAPKMSHIGY